MLSCSLLQCAVFSDETAARVALDVAQKASSSPAGVDASPRMSPLKRRADSLNAASLLMQNPSSREMRSVRARGLPSESPFRNLSPSPAAAAAEMPADMEPLNVVGRSPSVSRSQGSDAGARATVLQPPTLPPAPVATSLPRHESVRAAAPTEIYYLTLIPVMGLEQSAPKVCRTRVSLYRCLEPANLWFCCR